MILKDFEGQLQPKALDLLHSLYSRRLELAEVTSALEGISLPGSLTGAWYRALASAAATLNPELENWALRRSLDTGNREADTWIALHRNWTDMGNLAQADSLDAEIVRLLCAEGRAAEAVPYLRRLCESEVHSPSVPFPLGDDCVRSVLAYSASGDGSHEIIRASLRALLAPRLGGARPGAAYNLVTLDLDGEVGTSPEKRLEAFTALLAAAIPPPRNRLEPTRDLRFLFRVGGRYLLVEAGRAIALDLDEAGYGLATEAAQFHYAPFSPPAPAAQASEYAEGDVSRRSLSNREGHAVANFDAMVPIFAEVLGVAGFTHPQLKASVAAIREGAAKFFRTGVNSEPGYGSLVGIYCASNGLSNDFLSFLIRLYNPPYRLGAVEGILGRFNATDVADIAATLRRDGLYRFPKLIPQDLLDDLIRIGHGTPCYPHPEAGVGKDACLYPAGAPKEIKYDFIERDLVPMRPVQRIMADPGLLAVSQAYFGAKPVLDAVAMWWSTHVTGLASSEAAQLYHFDMERMKWLKWFIYLTDVDTATGPHCFVRGSHRTGAKPFELLKRGYQRISDEDMARHYPAADLLELTGPKGSIFVEDTSGFHKGKPPSAGPRLVIELEFSNSLYGALFPREVSVGRDAHPDLLALARKHPQVLCKYAIRD